MPEIPSLPPQLGVWAAEQLTHRAESFLITQLVWLDGELDDAVLADAVRTSLSEADVLHLEPRQHGDDVLLASVPGDDTPSIEDAVHTDDEVREAALARWHETAAEDRYRVRTRLLRRQTGWAWELIVHHLLLDAYGLGLITRRAAEVYSARIRGEEPPARWFGDYAQLTADRRIVDAHDFWAERFTLAAQARATEHPIGRFTLQHRIDRGLDTERAARIDELAARAHVSWSDVVLAAWGLATAAWDGSDLIAVRLPQMGRSGRVELTTPAMLVGAAPLLLRLSPDWTVDTLLQAVRGEARAAARHTSDDAELARTWPLGAADYQSRPQLNIKAFDYQHRFGETRAHPESLTAGPVGRLDLSVYRDDVHGFRLGFATNDALAADGLSLLADAFIGLLDTLTAAAPHARLGGLPLPAADSDLTGASAEPVTTVDALLQERCRRSPGAIAVSDETGRLSYRRLDARIQAFTAELRRAGVGAGSRVGVALGRSTWLVIALASVLRAGGVCVPLDLGQPVSRLRLMLEDASPALLISDAAGEAVMDAVGATQPRLRVDEATAGARATAPQAERSSARAPHPADAAYVIFTSGTTGRPKGVVLSHRALANRLQWGARALGLGPGSIMAVKAATGFVDAATELFGPLIMGARLTMLPDADATDPARLCAAVARESVTHLLTVPSLADAIAQLPHAEVQLRDLRHWVSSGEALSPGVRDAMRRLAPSAQVTNLYGSTEVTGDATRADADLATTIGVPVPGTSAVMLDPWLRPVPSGTTGELYVGGVQLADGYLGRPALTASRFVAAESGGRWYRTGDLARRRPDGIEYLGRSDDQVKIRGIRVELDEVRTVLESHPGVNRAAVVVADGASGPVLAAYVTARHRDPGLADAVRRYATDRLPGAMVPAFVTLLERFPLTPGGKLDRAALPAPLLGSRGGESLQGAERELAELVAEVLGLDADALAADDDFFALGGHSLAATRLVARLNARGAELTLRDVFDRPRIAQLAPLIAGAAPSRLHPGDLARPDEVPVSYGQQSMWLTDQLGGAAGRYNVPAVFEVRGPFNEAAWTLALRDLIARHETLRTCLIERDGRLLQHIVSTTEASERMAVPADDVAEAELDRLIAERIRAPFRLDHDLPIRAAILRASGRRVLVLAVHHHAIDEWSMPVLLQELASVYADRSAGRAPDLPPLPIQYADYAIWQRATLGDAAEPDSEAAQLLVAWQAALDGAPESSTLGLDRPRADAPTYEGDEVRFSLTAEELAQVRALADALEVTTFTIAHAATALALCALSDSDDVVIGSPLGGRTEPGLESLVGYFANPVPLRHRLRPRDTVAEFLTQTKQTVLHAFAHQAVPFELIVGAVGAPRTGGQNPLFQCMLAHHVGAQGAGARFGDTTTRLRQVPLGAVKTDLDLDLIETDAGLAGILSYATELFDRSTAQRFVQAIRAAFTSMVRTPDARLAELELAPSGDAVPAGVRTDALQASLDVPTLLARSATEAASRVAVSCGGTEASYRELADRAFALAQALRGAGIGRGDRVALLLPRSLDTVVAVWGVLAAGAAYVPIDPAYPDERTRFILAQCRPAAIIIDPPVRQDRPGLDEVLRGIRVIDVPPAGTDAGDPEARVHPADAAAVVFTSGTTGLPKGVVVSHGALANRVTWGVRRLEFTADSVTLAKTGVGFVDAATELLTPLAAGAGVRIVPDPDARDPELLRRELRAHRATHLLTVPTLAGAMGVPSEGRLDTLRHWVVSGERLTPEVRDRMRALAPTASLHDFYGSTEVTGDATAARVDDGPLQIGRPLPNTSVRVLDPWLRPSPAGVRGELYVGGAQLALGYLGATHRTAERFVPDPLGHGARLYRTGDLARWRADGTLEFLGRGDQQISIRGFRIEPEEVRVALQALPEVADAAIGSFTHPAGGPRLCAYVTLHAPDANEEALRAALGARLPDYMVPDRIIVLEAMPVTPNGKLDRAALPAVQHETGGAGGVAASVTERAVEAAFRDTLSLDSATPLGVDDDFFRLGGDSILAARLAAIARSHGVTFTVRDVFELRTIGRIAERHASTARTPSDEPVTLPVIPAVEALRASGDAAWVTGAVADARLSEAELAARMDALGELDALRVRVTQLNRRVWTSELLASASPQLICAPGVSDEEAFQLAQRRVNAAERRAIVAVTVPDSGRIVVAAHIAAADPRTTQALAQALARADSTVCPASAPLAEMLQRLGEHTVRSSAEQWAVRLEPLVPIDGAMHADRAAASDTVHRFELSTAGPSAVLVTALIRSARAGELLVDGVDGEAQFGDGLGPVTGLAPAGADRLDPRDFLVLKHLDPVGRRVLRRDARTRLALVTRQWGELPCETRIGWEQHYPVVVRYLPNATGASVTVIGATPAEAAAMTRRAGAPAHS